ncbi:hypothetical protein M427DRAFT_458409 [Gonapodya prolifera JEL478]|uniref:Uncharacterized protein n=1 Tax=Gonapodya prolifera (strain JEL478) TaxID=1344416 RepID=A0A139A248_GONPJ|nr:hypothetical protein M427DRAFT_458409 [Gonapodya prolifera JEL478]|eukprot:KXS10842.1 hypothetical protein M427DRAFT_458409 [Gonapodya prolifera JEL478]
MSWQCTLPSIRLIMPIVDSCDMLLSGIVTHVENSDALYKAPVQIDDTHTNRIMNSVRNLIQRTPIGRALTQTKQTQAQMPASSAQPAIETTERNIQAVSKIEVTKAPPAEWNWMDAILMSRLSQPPESDYRHTFLDASCTKSHNLILLFRLARAVSFYLSSRVHDIGTPNIPQLIQPRDDSIVN